MTSFIDLRTSKGAYFIPLHIFLFFFYPKAKSALSKDREDHSNNKLIGSGINGLGSSRFGAQNQPISDLSFSKNGLSIVNRTPGQNQASEITRKKKKLKKPEKSKKIKSFKTKQKIRGTRPI